MTAPPRSLVQDDGSAQPLVLYACVRKELRDDLLARMVLSKEEGWWYIGLRQEAQEALDRAGQVEEEVGKESHIMLEITFSPLGVAYFGTTYADWYQYMPILHKVYKPWATYDKGVWHYLDHLPLWLTDAMGNVLIATEMKEII